MKVNLEYNPDDPEDVILAERIIKCNAMASVLWKLMTIKQQPFLRKDVINLLEDENIDIERIWS